MAGRERTEEPTLDSDTHIDRAAAHRALEALRTLLPGEVVLTGGRVEEASGALYPEESRQIVRAVAKRQQEYRAGRLYARAALATLGMDALPMPAGPTRAPVWPRGAIGSITHTAGVCAVAVARASRFLALGLDLEQAMPLDDELLSYVCLEEELRCRAYLEGLLGMDLPKALFVVKECVYKAYHPMTGSTLEFHDVAVSIDPLTATFSARTLRPDPHAMHSPRHFSGRLGHTAGLAFAFTGLPAPD